MNLSWKRRQITWISSTERGGCPKWSADPNTLMIFGSYMMGVFLLINFANVHRVLNPIDANVLVLSIWPKHDVLMNINVSKIKHVLIYVS